MVLFDLLRHQANVGFGLALVAELVDGLAIERFADGDDALFQAAIRPRDNACERQSPAEDGRTGVARRLRTLLRIADRRAEALQDVGKPALRLERIAPFSLVLAIVEALLLIAGLELRLRLGKVALKLVGAERAERAGLGIVIAGGLKHGGLVVLRRAERRRIALIAQIGNGLVGGKILSTRELRLSDADTIAAKRALGDGVADDALLLLSVLFGNVGHRRVDDAIGVGRHVLADRLVGRRHGLRIGVCGLLDIAGCRVVPVVGAPKEVADVLVGCLLVLLEAAGIGDERLGSSFLRLTKHVIVGELKVRRQLLLGCRGGVLATH